MGSRLFGPLTSSNISVGYIDPDIGFVDGVSICNLDNVMKNAVIRRSNKYQVWSDKHRCYNLYANLDEAVDKFMSLTTKISR